MVNGKNSRMHSAVRIQTKGIAHLKNQLLWEKRKGLGGLNLDKSSTLLGAERATSNWTAPPSTGTLLTTLTKKMGQDLEESTNIHTATNPAATRVPSGKRTVWSPDGRHRGFLGFSGLRGSRKSILGLIIILGSFISFSFLRRATCGGLGRGGQLEGTKGIHQKYVDKKMNRSLMKFIECKPPKQAVKRTGVEVRLLTRFQNRVKKKKNGILAKNPV